MGIQDNQKYAESLNNQPEEAENALNEQFINSYRMLEGIAKSKYPGFQEASPMVQFESDPLLNKDERNTVSNIRKLRNILEHWDPKYVNKPVVIDPALIRFLDKLIAKFSLKARDIMSKKVYTVTLDDIVEDTVTMMRKKWFSYVPIVDSNKRVIDVFSATHIFRALLHEKIFEIDITHKELSTMISSYRSISDEYEIYVTENQPVYEIKEAFSKLSQRGILTLAIVTDNGERSGKLKGVISAWDLLQTENKSRFNEME